MIYLLLSIVLWMGFMFFVIGKVMDMTGNSLTAVVFTGLGLFAVLLIIMSLMIDAIVEGRIPL